MIKLSDLLECVSPPDEQTDLMNLAIATAKRLEALDVPRVEAERKPLVDGGGDEVYIIVDENGIHVNWQLTQQDADNYAHYRTEDTGQPHTVCQVMSPESGECPTIPVATFTPERGGTLAELGCDITWAILDCQKGLSNATELYWLTENRLWSSSITRLTATFNSRDAAQDVIDREELSAIPFPVPKLTS